MTDNEIKKALECCTNYNGTGSCVDCPLANYSFEECADILRNEALDFINRQKAEIERLQNVIFKKEDTMQMIAKEKQEYFDKLQTVKSEAIKEFAEKLKGYAIGENGSKEKAYFFVEVQDIDNLVKEMTEVETNEIKRTS